MTTPILVSPKNETAEALMYDGTPQSAWDIMAVLRNDPGTQVRSLSMSYLENAGMPPEFYFYLEGTAHNIGVGDWLIKDAGMYSVCRASEFGDRFEVVL